MAKKETFKLTSGIYMWDMKHFYKCSRCGLLTGMISIRECIKGYVSCDMQPTREFKDLRQFAWMAIQDKMWRYATWYQRRENESDRMDSWEGMALSLEQVKSITNDLLKMSRKRKIIIDE